MSQKQSTSASASAGSKNPPHGDVSFIRATPTGAFSPLTPSPGREKNTPSSGSVSNPYPHPAMPSSGLSPRLAEAGGGVIGGVWSDREEMLSRELEEAKVRVAQMEKTMRWWSDCTANWRDKWNKARNERNKAREENRQLRARLDAAIKECTTLKRRLQGRAPPGDPDSTGLKSPAGDIGSATEQASEGGSKRDSVKSISGKDSSSSSDISIPSAVLKSEKEKQEDFSEKDIDDAESKTVVDERLFGPEPGLMSSPLYYSSKSSGLDSISVAGTHDENANASSAVAASEQVVQLQQQLDAAQKMIQLQTHEKDTLSRTIESLEEELSSLRVRCEEVRQSRQELVHQVSKMREDHQNELVRLTSDLEDENSKTMSMDRRLTELRRELERLQAENAAEWQKRERLETDKQLLERENRKLRTQVNDLEEQLQRKHQLAAASVDSDLRTLQFDLSEKTKELTELRHAHNKVRKTLNERVTELEHSKRRADQYEAEVKKLRGRVEELKRDLATAEDEVDMQTNSVRRLQRSNDELQEQVDNLTLQVDHLQNRLRRGSQSLPKTRSSSLKSFNMEDSAELADSEDDLEET